MSEERDSGDDKDLAKEEVESSISQDIVVTKYNMAAEIANAVIVELIKQCVADKLILELCEFGDTQLLERTAKVFKKEKAMKKGIAFPTCISVNNCICHFSPLKSEGADVKLRNGDLVKIDLGAHIDGFIATAAHSFVFGASAENKVKGRKADCILAAYNCMEGAIRMLRPKQYKSTDVSETIQRIAESFHCKPVENMLSFQLKRNQVGNEDDAESKQIIQNPSDDQRQKMKKHEFCAYEVYAIDVLVSTGEGKGRDLDTRTTVYKRDENVTYLLKMKNSRQFFHDASARFDVMPFSLRMFEDERMAKVGIKECENHNLMKPFKVYYERDAEFVAQFKATVLVMPNGLLKITGLPMEEGVYESEYSIEDKTLKQLIQSSLKPSKKKQTKKKEVAAPVAQNGV